MFTILISKKFNLKFFISYLGILPFFFILLDFHITSLFIKDLLKEFAILYILIIFSFIGAMRWSFNENTNSLNILYGFFPSFLSTILISLYLLNYNKDKIFLIIFILFFFQLIGDYFFIKKNINEKIFFFKVRLPVTLFILINIFYLIFV